MAFPAVAKWWRGLDRPGWRSFALAMAALSVALLLALYSASAAEIGRTWLAGGAAAAALALAGWVAVTIVPTLARRTSLRWLIYQVDYRLTREGIVYLAAVFVLVLAAVNTGNNLLFMILACLLAGILISGLLSRAVLTGVTLVFDLPEHIFATQPVVATLELHNEKQMMPSFSLQITGQKGKQDGAQILTRPVYFPHIPRKSSARQKVELTFPRRGIYRQDAFRIRTKFPFGFLEKARRQDAGMEIVVYPQVEPTDEFYEILPLLSGEMDSFYRGRGHDLHSIREYQATDSARFVDWKASARTGTLKVREFTREDERRLLLSLVAAAPARPSGHTRADFLERFERAVSLAACIAWHFYEVHSVLQFRAGHFSTPMAPAGETIYEALHALAMLEPGMGPDPAKFLEELAVEPDVFKIVLTSQPRGSVPTPLWNSSYMIFFDAL